MGRLEKKVAEMERESETEIQQGNTKRIRKALKWEPWWNTANDTVMWSWSKAMMLFFSLPTILQKVWMRSLRHICVLMNHSYSSFCPSCSGVSCQVFRYITYSSIWWNQVDASSFLMLKASNCIFKIGVGTNLIHNQYCSQCRCHISHPHFIP